MNRHAWSLTLLVAVLAGPAAATAQSQSAAVEAAVTRIATEYLEAWNAHDLERVMRIFDGPRGWFMLGGSALATTDSLSARARTEFEARTSDGFRWSRVQVHVLNPDIAYFQGVYGGQVSYKDGRVLEWKDNATMTALFERRGADWKITSVHFAAGNGTPVTK